MNNLTDTKWPKISIVTPNYNMDQYLEDTIKSIVDQGYPNLEYIIIDGGSTDRSVEIIKKYEPHLSYWISEPDQGMYEAIQKGFERSSGEIMGWLNSDDMLHPNSLFTMASLFTQFPSIKWLQGLPTFYDKTGKTVSVANLRKWSKYQYYQKEFKWIQQESTYWRRSLWEQAGQQLDTDLKYAGDLELWTRFFRFAQLYCTNALIGGFRVRLGEQLSSNMEAYLDEANSVINKEINSLSEDDSKVLKLIQKRKRIKRFLIKLRVLNVNLFERRLITPLLNFPPYILYNHSKDEFYLRK